MFTKFDLCLFAFLRRLIQPLFINSTGKIPKEMLIFYSDSLHNGGIGYERQL